MLQSDDGCPLIILFNFSFGQSPVIPKPFGPRDVARDPKAGRVASPTVGDQAPQPLPGNRQLGVDLDHWLRPSAVA